MKITTAVHLHRNQQIIVQQKQLLILRTAVHNGCYVGTLYRIYKKVKIGLDNFFYMKI